MCTVMFMSMLCVDNSLTLCLTSDHPASWNITQCQRLPRTQQHGVDSVIAVVKKPGQHNKRCRVAPFVCWLSAHRTIHISQAEVYNAPRSFQYVQEYFCRRTVIWKAYNHKLAATPNAPHNAGEHGGTATS